MLNLAHVTMPNLCEMFHKKLWDVDDINLIRRILPTCHRISSFTFEHM